MLQRGIEPNAGLHELVSSTVTECDQCFDYQQYWSWCASSSVLTVVFIGRMKEGKTLFSRNAHLVTMKATNHNTALTSHTPAVHNDRAARESLRLTHKYFQAKLWKSSSLRMGRNRGTRKIESQWTLDPQLLTMRTLNSLEMKQNVPRQTSRKCTSRQACHFGRLPISSLSGLHVIDFFLNPRGYTTDGKGHGNARC